ncbi:NDR1/HIN1-like protein 6 [Cucurbita moschata]|uniref:NDR1/HIN1-like protein 6 n=1 Tax=Cucurbita moschata TaxID=3662 RepID=A0A6J1F873_CUCMO|nr:NDR1/HIN1-like protein 6 [Cucurbita moschata]XP_022936400.1 NDR1/HIN1-like protein 6 [Cucurbita moschata]
MQNGAHPPPKPAVNGSAAPPTANGTAPASGGKPQFRQQPYRPPPYRHHSNHHRSRRNLCCCFCFWTIIIVLGLALLAAIAGAALYVLYRPHRPQFTISSLRISKLNLTTAADSSASHVSSLFNLTLSSFNPNSHITFAYDPFTLSCFSNSVLLANGSIPAFTSATKNQTVFRSLMSGAEDLDADSFTSLRSDLKKKGGAPLTIEMDTKVKVKIGGVNSKKVGIRVTCEGIKGTPPKGKQPTVASVSDADCKVDLRIKIWIFTL